MKSQAHWWPRDVPVFQAVAIIAPRQSAPVRASRHGSPDLIAQLEQANRYPVDTILCSALDDDAALRLNAAVAARQAERVVAGIRQARDRTGARRVWIAVEVDSPSPWISQLRDLATAENMSLVEMPNHYPQADPTLLIYTLASRRLRPGHLPVEQGILLLDTPAAAALGAGEMPVVPIGILDHESGKSHYLEVPLGMSLGDAISAAGISGEAKMIYSSDWRRDRRVPPATLIDGADLTFHVCPTHAQPPAEPCIRCGWCGDVCPTGVSPALVLEAAQRGDAAMARKGGVGACIECGLCDQICPANLPLLAGVRAFVN